MAISYNQLTKETVVLVNTLQWTFCYEKKIITKISRKSCSTSSFYIKKLKIKVSIDKRFNK